MPTLPATPARQGRTTLNHPAIIILGYSEAAMYLRGTPAPAVTGIVSIHGHREFGVEANVDHRLDLTFDDVEVAVPTDMASVQRATSRRRWAAQNGLIEVPPTRDDAAAIILFAEQAQPLGGTILCHCFGGMSRAPAAALICLTVWRGAGSEVECVRQIRRLRAGAVPHPGLVAFADELLGRRGKLIGAL